MLDTPPFGGAMTLPSPALSDTAEPIASPDPLRGLPVRRFVGELISTGDRPEKLSKLFVEKGCVDPALVGMPANTTSRVWSHSLRGRTHRRSDGSAGQLGRAVHRRDRKLFRFRRKPAIAQFARSPNAHGSAAQQPVETRRTFSSKTTSLYRNRGPIHSSRASFRIDGGAI